VQTELSLWVAAGQVKNGPLMVAMPDQITTVQVFPSVVQPFLMMVTVLPAVITTVAAVVQDGSLTVLTMAIGQIRVVTDGPVVTENNQSADTAAAAVLTTPVITK